MNTNPRAKRILIYGDSLTWGTSPDKRTRFGPHIRFTGVTQKELGNNYEIIEEGLGSRMAEGEHPNTKGRNGWEQFEPILRSHIPLDLLILLLGTNDSNYFSNKDAVTIGNDLKRYLENTRKVVEEKGLAEPKVLIIIPPIVNEKFIGNDKMFIGAQNKMRELQAILPSIAADNSCYTLDSNKYVTVSPMDGVHLDERAHQILGKELGKYIKNILLD